MIIGGRTDQRTTGHPTYLPRYLWPRTGDVDHHPHPRADGPIGRLTTETRLMVAHRSTRTAPTIVGDDTLLLTPYSANSVVHSPAAQTVSAATSPLQHPYITRAAP